MKSSLAIVFLLGLGCVVTAEPPKGLGGKASAATPAPTPTAAPAPTPADVRTPAARSPAPAREPTQPVAAPAAGTPPQLEVLTKATGEASPARTTAAAGTEQRVAHQIAGSMKYFDNGKELMNAELPTITVEWLARVDSVAPDGSRVVTMTVQSATQDGLHPDERLRKAADRNLAIIREMQATMTVGPSGAPGPMTVKLPGRSHNDLRAAVESVTTLLPQVFVTVPDEAIGVGSSWKASAPVDLAELHLQQSTTYRVLSRNEQGVQVSIDTGYTHTPGAVAGDSRQVKKLDGTVKGNLTFDPTKLVADRGEATMHLELGSDVIANGETIPSVLELDLRITLTPK